LEEVLDLAHEEKKEDFLDPAYPLLKQLRDAAPGTFKHAQSLTGMVQNVCAAIAIDSHILEVVAMYHDIGKMWAPGHFSENQHENENIHEGLDPFVSYELITRHVSDSVTILLSANFPLEVIVLASQHHGKTILTNFYELAKVKNSKVPEELFRYKTPRPTSVESLILMLCDQIEATSRSIYASQHLDVAPDVFVSNVYAKLHQDGQFDNVQIFLGTLKKILRAIIADVGSMFQKRIRYEEDKELITDTKIKKELTNGSED
jgi:hypothetical protein